MRGSITRRKAMIMTLAAGMGAPALWGAARPSVNVKDFGAVGDGIVDDTAAIERAFSRGGSIFFPSGIYCYSPSEVTGFLSNTEIFGEGSSTVIKYQPSTDPVTSDVQQILRPRGFSNVENIVIRNIVLDGNRDHVNWSGIHAGDGNAIGLGLWGTQNVFIDNVTARNCWTDGFYFAYTHWSQPGRRQCRYIRIGTIYAENCGRQGMSIISAEDVMIDSLIVDSINRVSPRAALDMEPNNVNPDKIKNITIGSILARGTGAGVLISGVSIIENISITSVCIKDVRRTFGVTITRAKNVHIGDVVVGMANATYYALYANEYDTFHIGSFTSTMDSSVRTGGQGGILVDTPSPEALLKNRNGRIDHLNLNGTRGDGFRCGSVDLSVGEARIANSNMAANGSKAFVPGPGCRIVKLIGK